MNIFDGFQELVAAVIRQLGLFAVVPGFVLGVVLVVLAIVLFRKSNKGSGIGIRIVGGIAITLGLPILLVALGVGATDALLWSIIALFASAIWLAGAKGKIVTIVGILVAVIALGGLVSVTNSNPEGSLMADNLRTISDRGQILWDNTVVWGSAFFQ